jgi:hypothetical protein
VKRTVARTTEIAPEVTPRELSPRKRCMVAMAATSRVEAADIAIAVATAAKVTDTKATTVEVVAVATETVVLAEDPAAVAAVDTKIRVRRYLLLLRVALIKCSQTTSDSKLRIRRTRFTSTLSITESSIVIEVLDSMQLRVLILSLLKFSVFS